MFIDGPIEFVLDFRRTTTCAHVRFTRWTMLATRRRPSNDHSRGYHCTGVFEPTGVFIEVNEQKGKTPEPFVAIQDACDGNAQWSSSDVDQLEGCGDIHPDLHGC